VATICFDLDGTLVDPLLGVKHCVARVCREMGLPVPAEADIRDWIGFGMRESLGRIPGLEEPARLEEALDRYLDAYREDGGFGPGGYESHPMPRPRPRFRGSDARRGT